MSASKAKEATIENPSKLELVRSLGTVFIWAIGLIFIAGITYSKVTSIETSDKDQEKLVSIIKEAQIKTSEGVDRLEKSQERLSDQVSGWMEKMSERQAKMDKRILRNEIDIENLKEKNKNRVK